MKYRVTEAVQVGQVIRLTVDIDGGQSVTVEVPLARGLPAALDVLRAAVRGARVDPPPAVATLPGTPMEIEV